VIPKALKLSGMSAKTFYIIPALGYNCEWHEGVTKDVKNVKRG
jgi:hypothetical protein